MAQSKTKSTEWGSRFFKVSSRASSWLIKKEARHVGLQYCICILSDSCLLKSLHWLPVKYRVVFKLY